MKNFNLRYGRMKIIDVNDVGLLPVSGKNIIDRVKELCEEAKKKLINEWLADVAELFLERKHAWSGLFDKKQNSSIGLIEKYFDSVDALLSKQLRIVLLRTIKHLRDFFVQYKNGNVFEGSYEDLTFTR